MEGLIFAYIIGQMNMPVCSFDEYRIIEQICLLDGGE